MKTKLTKLFNWRAVTRCFTLLAAVGLTTAAQAATYTGKVISINIANALNSAGGWVDTTSSSDVETIIGGIPGTGWQNVGDTTDSGSKRQGSKTGINSWNGSAAETISDLTFAWNCNNADMGNLYASVSTSISFLKCLYTRANQTGLSQQNMTFTGIPYDRYDVIVYFSGTTAKANQSVTFNGTAYYGDTSSSSAYKTVQGNNTSWGAFTSPTALTYGGNVLRVEGFTSTTMAVSVPSSSAKWGIAAIQVIDTTLAASDYVATISEDSNWTALDWDPDWPTGGADGAIANLTVGATSTLTINEDETMNKLAVTSEAGNDLTVAKGDGVTATIATYDFSGASGKTTVGCGTGTAAVKAGADTVLAETGTGTLTIGSGLKATVPAWGAANVAGAGTIDISAASASTAVTWGETANFTGTMRLLTGTWTVSAGGNSAGYPRKSAVEVVGSDAMLKLTTANDATGYNGDLSKSLTIKDGGTLRVERRDTFSRTMNLDNGNVVFNQDATDSSRAFDLHGSATIHVTGTGTSTFGGTTAGSIVNSGIISLRNTPTITVDANAQFDIYSQWGGNSGYNAWTKAGAGKIVFYRPVQSSMTAKATISAGTVQFANGGQGTLGEIALASGTKLELNVTASDGSYTAANTVTGAGRVFKVGAGTYTLTGANTYTGGTTVSAGTLAAATAKLGTGAVTVNSGATLRLTLTDAQIAGATTLFTSTMTAEELTARVTTFNAAGTAIPGTFTKGDNDAVVFTPSVEFYTLEMTDGNSYDWSGNIWTKNGESGQTYAPAEGKVGDVTITVSGTATLNVTGTPASLGGISFTKADGADTAVVTVKYTPTTLPESSAANVSYNVFGLVPTVGDGVTYSFEPTLDAKTYAWQCDATAGTFIATKRPTMGSINIKIGPRTSNVTSSITPDLESVGANPLSGLLWTNAKLWNNNNSSYTDFIYVDDASGSGKQIQYVFRGPNTYFNSSNPQNTGNAILTASYVDDGDSAASTTWEVTNPDDETDKVTLPAAENARGWQIHLGNLPYAAFDLYFITASDQTEANLKETPIKLSADGGATWVCYTGDSDNQQTKIGTDNWKGAPYATGELVEAKNYLKMRVSAAIMGVDKLTSLEITHGTRNTGSYIRSGLAAIQIVELDNDGVFTLAEDNGNWTADAIWSSGGVTGKTWLNDGTAYAKIAADGTIASVTLDAAVNAQQVTLTGDGDFTVNGTGSMASALGFDMTKFWGRLTMNAPVGGNYTLASGKFTLNNADAAVTLGGTASNVVVTAGTLKFASKSVVVNDSVIQVNGGTLDLNGLDIQHAYELAGGSLVNNGGNIGNNLAQMNGLTLTGDATIGGSGNFGLISYGYAENTLTLGANTLTKTGDNSFWLCNTTVSGAGTIQVDAGTLAVSDNSGNAKTTTFAEGTISIGASGTLQVNANKALTVKTLKGATGATITNNGTITLAEAEDVDFSNVGGTIAGVDGAITVKGTVKTTSGKFGSANITVADGAKIDLVIDTSATEATITTGTLTFPEGQSLAGCVTINGGSSAKWKIKENGKIYDASRQAYYAATVSATPATWSTKEGLTKTSADDWANGVNSTITLASATADAVLTFDAATTAATLKVTGAANLTLKKGADIDVQIAAIDLTEATGTITIDFDVGAATIASGASTVLNAVGTGNITIAADQTLTVKASGLKASQVTNNGTLHFQGGTSDDPIAITGDGDFGVTTLAVDTYVKNTVSDNHKHQVTGAGASSCYALTGSGFSTGTAYTNLTLVSLATGNGVWIERGIDENVRLLVPEGKAVMIGNNTDCTTYTPTFIALNGAGTVQRQGGASNAVIINCTEAAEFSGTSSLPFTIGGTAEQTLSGNYTGALTVNENAKAALKVGADYALNVNNAGTLRLIDNDTPKMTLTSATFNNSGTLDLSGTGIDTISIGTLTAFGTVTWPTDVAGTVKIACDSTRDLTDLATKLEGFAGTKEFAINETLAENLTGKVSLTGVPVDAKIVLTRYVDGSVIEKTATTAGTLDIAVTPLIYGKACLFDFTFTNTVEKTSSTAIAPAAGSRKTDNVHGDSNAEYTNYDEESEWYKALKTKVRPYMGYNLATPYSVAVAGCFPSETNTCLVSVGSSVNCVFLASGRNPNEVVLVRVNGHCPEANNRFNIDNCEVLTTMTVPNSATTMHSIVFETADMQTVNIYLDGTKWSSYHFETATALGTGFQIGGFYGGSAYDDCYRQANSTTAPNSYVSAIRIYDSELNQAAISQFAKEFEYISPSGEYSRTIGNATATWSSENAWTFSKDESTVDVPTAGGIVKLTASVGTTIAVNLAENVSYEELTLTGNMLITTNAVLETHGGKISVTGKVKVDGNVTNDYAAIDISGSPITIVSGGVCFDMRSYDASNVFATKYVALTGLASADDADKLTALLPADQFGRTFTFGYNTTTENYGMTITVTSAPFIYTVAKDEETGVWTWNGQEVTAAQVAAQASGEIQKAGEGTATLTQQSGFTYTVNAGTLKFSSVLGTETAIAVNTGATFDLNGQSGSAYTITLAGGSLVNTGAALADQNTFTTLTLTADSKLGGTSNFTMQKASYAATTINLGGYTLTKEGDNSFSIVTTTINDAGTIYVEKGTLYSSESTTFTDATASIKVGESGVYQQRESSGGVTRKTTVANVIGEGGTLNVEGAITGFNLTGTLTLANAGTYGTITNAENAVANIGTRLNYYTFAGAGSVKAQLTEKHNPGDTVAIFNIADSATTGIAELKDASGDVIDPSYYTFSNGTVTFKKEAAKGSMYYFTLKQAIEEQTGAATIELVADVTDDEAITVAQAITFEGGTNILSGASFSFKDGGTLTLNTGCIGITHSDNMTAGGCCRFIEGVTNSWAAYVPSGYEVATLSTAIREGYQYEFVKSGFVPSSDEVLMPVADENGNDAGAIKLKSDWVKTATGKSTASEQAVALNTKQTNNMMTWQNKILGLDGTKKDSIPVVAPVQSTSTSKITFKLGGCEVATDSGATVTYKVYGSTDKSSWSAVSEETSHNKTASVDLPTSGVKYYKFEVITATSK